MYENANARYLKEWSSQPRSKVEQMIDKLGQTYNYRIWNKKYARNNKIPISIGVIDSLHQKFEVVLAIKIKILIITFLAKYLPLYMQDNLQFPFRNASTDVRVPSTLNNKIVVET